MSDIQELKKEIIKLLNGFSGKYSRYEVYSDWVELTALAIANNSTMERNIIWSVREEQYKAIIHKYKKDEITAFGNMTGALALALEAEERDVLGEIFMEAELRSKETGQFFTPFHLSLLCAKMQIHAEIEEYQRGDLKKIELYEPSSGAGGMVIASAKILKENGINYQKALRVVTQDLDWRCVYMCYVQLSLLGIHAICVQDDTLRSPYDPSRTEESHILVTPAGRGMLV